MTEYASPTGRQFLDCGEVLLNIKNEQDLEAMLLDTGFHTVIAHQEFQPGQLTHVVESTFLVEPETKEQSRTIAGTVKFSRSSGTMHWSDQDFLEAAADFMISTYDYDKEWFDFHDEGNYPYLTIRIDDVIAIVELINIDDVYSAISVKVPLDHSVDDDASFSAVKDSLLLWSELHDFISYESKGKHQRASSTRTEIVIERYSQTDAAMRVWHALLNYEGWKEEIGIDNLPVIQYQELDIERLGDLLDTKSDDFDFTKAIQRSASQLRKCGSHAIGQTELQLLL